MKPVSKKLFTASTGPRCIGSIVGWHVCFISCYGPFFHIWPLATSQRQWSEVSTPRHNNLSGKNISLMLQSYIVWDDSESERGLLFGCLCSAAALLWNGGGFPPAWVFLDLCVNSRELCTVWGSEGATPMHVCGNPVVSCRHVIDKKNQKRMCLETGRPSLRLHNYCCVGMEMLSRGKAALVQTDLWRDFQLKFHGVFSRCFRFDRSGLGWIAAAGSSSSLDTGRSLKCFEGSSLGSPEGPWPPWVMLSARSLSLTDVNGGDHAGGSQAHRWAKSRE